MLSLLGSLAGPILGGLFGGGNRAHGGAMAHGGHFAHGGYADGGYADGGMPDQAQAPFTTQYMSPPVQALAPYAHGGEAGYSYGGMPHHMMGGQHYAHGGYADGGYAHGGMPHYAWGGLGGLLSSAWNMAKPHVQRLGSQALNAGAQHLAQNKDRYLGMAADKAGQLAQSVGNRVRPGMGDRFKDAAQSGVQNLGNQAWNKATAGMGGFSHGGQMPRNNYP